MYSQALAYQKNIHELQKHNFGKMTWQEKRLNREDLQHFKEHENSYNALIPGLNNLKSVGAAPLKRTKPRETEQPGKLRMTMSIDNLPCELPRDASEGFGKHLYERVMPSLIVKDDGVYSNTTLTGGSAYTINYGDYSFSSPTSNTTNLNVIIKVNFLENND